MRLIMRYFFKLVRAILGPLLLLANALTAPRGIKRSPEAQQVIDEQTRQLQLYQYTTCPFCIKVRRTIRRLSLNIDLLDAQHNPTHREQLLQQGGMLKVPCLRIDQGNGQVQWLYESSAIVQYLEQEFSGQHA
ncbi:MAG: glutaredoxin [Gammaproteobacteria bacterium]|nr:MAG: glutaredoxin [Gammaproteobacteria bacterium]